MLHASDPATYSGALEPRKLHVFCTCKIRLSDSRGNYIAGGGSVGIDGSIEEHR